MSRSIFPWMAHPTRKLGLRRAKVKAPRLKLHWQAGVVPSSPDAVDHHQGWSFDMGGNNQFGTCGPTSCANHEEMTSALLGGRELENPLDAVFDLYRRSGNPWFDPRTGRGDNGVVNTDMFAALLSGGLNGRKPVACAELVDSSDESLYAAIDLFGGVILAVDLETAQQSQTDSGYWDYSPSPEWGGHDILAGKYTKDRKRVHVITWAEDVYTTAEFRKHQLQEVWLIIWPEIADSQKLWDSGVDMASLAADYKALTGKDWPRPIQPPPPQPPAGNKIFLDLENRVATLPPGWRAVPNTGG